MAPNGNDTSFPNEMFLEEEALAPACGPAVRWVCWILRQSFFLD